MCEKYDVFLSFRGEDTRDNFISHLHAALLQNKVETYMDDKCLESGDEISPALLKAIEDSKIAVVVLSKNYAFSSWCLDELLHILWCKDEKRLIVLPVFYHVDPSYVRREVAKLVEERFADRVIINKVQEWKNALTKIANLSGRNSGVIRPESKLVDVIVEDIMKKLDQLPSSSSGDEFKGLVGIDRRMEQIEKLLNIRATNSVLALGIWGMGGIGKTTLARLLFKRFYSQFEGCCFLMNVKEETERRGSQYLHKKLLSELLEEDLNGSKFIALTDFFKERLLKKRVLIVLDDTSDSEQLRLMVGEKKCFGRGSRIIVTTRDVEVLKGIAINKRIYKVEELDDDEAFELFCFNAFRGTNFPGPGYAKLSKMATNYARGVPLALKVLGSSLCNKSEKKWETILDKLQEFPNRQIQNVLEISYHGLEDDNQKSIFLDIVCFFKGEDRGFVERILKYADTTIDDLVDKSLITVTPNNKLSMHNLIQKMGMEIVRKESIEEPGKRSRLWIASEICHVLKNNTGTNAVQGIFLDMSQITEINFSPVVFKNMCNLRLLKIYSSRGVIKERKIYLKENLHFLSDKLEYLQWDNYPFTSLPPDFTPENLVEFIMPNSRVKRLWNDVQCLGSLRKIDLSNCENLVQIPSLSEAKNLATLNLEGCSSLLKFPHLPSNIKALNLSKTSIKRVSDSSIESLLCLKTLDLSDCQALESLPTSICKLRSLQSLYLSGCSNFRSFPEILEPMKSLTELELDRTAIRELHSSIENLVALEILHLEMCLNLESVPSSIYNISSLDYVSLWRCTKLRTSPLDVAHRETNISSESSEVIRSSPSEDRSNSNADWLRPNSTVFNVMGQAGLVPGWDTSNIGSEFRHYNYLLRVPVEAAASSWARWRGGSEAAVLRSNLVSTPSKPYKLLSAMYKPAIRSVIALAKVFQREP